MHIQTITMDRTLRPQRIRWRSGDLTDFGFEAQGAVVPKARVLGHPPMRDEMTVSAVMPRPDDWMRMEGWYDHADETIYMPPPAREKAGAVLYGLGAAALALTLIQFYALMTLTELITISICMAALGGTAWFNHKRWRSKLQALDVLRERYPQARHALD